ncbi:MAG: methionine--tRNA ligase subunit beta [bacterium]
MTTDNINKHRRIVGIDFGSKRIGVAVSDELNLLAFPLVVIPGFGHDPEKRGVRIDQTKQEILEVLKEKDSNVVVIGHSVDLKGVDNAIMEDANFLGRSLEEQGFKVIYEPELFSTVQATKIQGDSKHVDASAAAIILQSYLDRIKFKNMNTQIQSDSNNEAEEIIVAGTKEEISNKIEESRSVPVEKKEEFITIDDVMKVDIKIGQIINAEKVEGSDKLLKLSVDFGEDLPRQVLSGISKFVEIEDLVGKKFPFVTNLAPRKMMGMESQAMILAGSTGDILALLNPSKDLPNGTKLK